MIEQQRRCGCNTLQLVDAFSINGYAKLHRALPGVRIVQVIPKSTPGANRPTVGLPHASPGKQVLGTVPVEADGSAFFRAPAGVPLAADSTQAAQPPAQASSAGRGQGQRDGLRMGSEVRIDTGMTRGRGVQCRRRPGRKSPDQRAKNGLVATRSVFSRGAGTRKGAGPAGPARKHRGLCQEETSNELKSLIGSPRGNLSGKA